MRPGSTSPAKRESRGDLERNGWCVRKLLDILSKLLIIVKLWHAPLWIEPRSGRSNSWKKALSNYCGRVDAACPIPYHQPWSSSSRTHELTMHRIHIAGRALPTAIASGAIHQEPGYCRDAKLDPRVDGTFRSFFLQIKRRHTHTHARTHTDIDVVLPFLRTLWNPLDNFKVVHGTTIASANSFLYPGGWH